MSGLSAPICIVLKLLELVTSKAITCTTSDIICMVTFVRLSLSYLIFILFQTHKLIQVSYKLFELKTKVTFGKAERFMIVVYSLLTQIHLGRYIDTMNE